MIVPPARVFVTIAALLTVLASWGCSSNSDSLSGPSATPTSDSAFHASHDCRLADLDYFTEVFGQESSHETPQTPKEGGFICVLDLPGLTSTSGWFSAVAMHVCTADCDQAFAKERANWVRNGGAKAGGSEHEFRVSEFHLFGVLGDSGESVSVSIAYVPDHIQPRIDLDVAAEHFARTALSRLENE